MNWLRNKIRKWLGITETEALANRLMVSLNKRCGQTDIEMESQRAELIKLRSFMENTADVHADIHYHKHADNWMILVGRRHGKTYVDCTPMRVSDFHDMCKELLYFKNQHHASLGRVDAPPGFEAVIKDEVNRD